MTSSTTNLTAAQAALLASIQRPGRYADHRTCGQIVVRNAVGGTSGKTYSRSSILALVDAGLVSRTYDDLGAGIFIYRALEDLLG